MFRNIKESYGNDGCDPFSTVTENRTRKKKYMLWLPRFKKKILRKYPGNKICTPVEQWKLWEPISGSFEDEAGQSPFMVI